MKKAFIALAMAFMLPVQSDAQFFKKLGKALKQVGKEFLETQKSGTSTSNSSLSSTSSGKSYTTVSAKTSITTSGATLRNAIPNIKIDILEAYHFGNGVVIKMTLTNTGTNTETFVFTGVNSQSFATEPSDHGDFSSYWKIGNHDWYHWGQEFNANCWDYKLEPGVKMAASCNLKGVKDEVSKIKTMRFFARLGGTSFYVGQEEKIYVAEIESLPVRVITGNTNQDNISFNLPTAKFNLLSCKNVNKTVTMTFSLTNTSDDDYTVDRINEVSIYDSDGNQYNISTMTLGTSSWLNNSIKLPAGITVKGSLTVSSVPISAKEFALFRFSFKSGDTYKVTIRNQTISNTTYKVNANRGNNGTESKNASNAANETMPSFPGGKQALQQYLAQNLKYPILAVENKIEGKVLVKFVVMKDGSLSNVSVVQPVNPLLDKEAVRVVQSMPKWSPGTLNGKAINVKYTIPISFKL